VSYAKGRAEVVFYYMAREPKYFNSFREAHEWACEWNRQHPNAVGFAAAFEAAELTE
jgi:hypothetical protein